MKIGVFGGSFDPIHKGHMNMAVSAQKEFGLDEIWLIPAGHSPNKNENRMTLPKHRLIMCRLAAERQNAEDPETRIIASDFEIRASERSYTYRTMEKLHDLYPEDQFYFIMGADSLDYFDEWRHPEIIAALSIILVVVREGFPEEAMEEKIRQISGLFPCDIRLVAAERYDISSSQIRAEIKNNLLCSRVLFPEVYDYIKEHHLYGF